MQDSYKLPAKLRKSVEKELEPNESIRWIEQPIARFFPRSVVGICLSLLVPIVFFSFTGFYLFNPGLNSNGILSIPFDALNISVIAMGTVIPLGLIICLPVFHWLFARQTVYIITNQRAIALTRRWSTTIYSFAPAELKALARREHSDGSGDVIVYTHRSKDYDGDIHTQEIGFKQLRDPKAFEKMLRQL